MDKTFYYEITDFPVVLTTTDVMNILRCCRQSALNIIKKGEKKGWFRVIWIGNSPRVGRDSFINWLELSKK